MIGKYWDTEVLGIESGWVRMVRGSLVGIDNIMLF
jgi:hypothetical protein